MSSISRKTRAVIFGCSGPRLLPEEQAFFTQTQPFGFILFQRNCENPDQVRHLVKDLRATVQHKNVPVLIDQEGGRVARLKPPHWPVFPAAGKIGGLGQPSGHCHPRENGGPVSHVHAIFDSRPADAGHWIPAFAGMTDLEGEQSTSTNLATQAAFLQGYLIARMLADLGITINCAPVCDVSIPGAHDVIGDRAYSTDPQQVAVLAGAFAKGSLAEGVLPVIKHIPGHGRAQADSHKDLPVVAESYEKLAKTDFIPFQKLASFPLGMTAHVLYTALDDRWPATLSPTIIQKVIRQDIGFEGLLLSDDLSMMALGKVLPAQDFGIRALTALKAGVDIVLHCNGKMEEMKQISAVIPVVSDAARSRWENAQKLLEKSRSVIQEKQDILTRRFWELVEGRNSD